MTSGTRCIIFTALLAALPLEAQDARGTVLGRVVDPTGAAVPGADVRITNANTGVAAGAKTNDLGNFSMPYLLPGTYTLTAEAGGFKKWVRTEIQVRINDSVEVNVALEVGATTETIEVKDTTPLLSTAEASLGQVIDERRVLELPLFAGNAMDLVHLAPGTVNGTNLRLRKAAFNAAPSQFSTDGGGNNQNEFSIDGVSNTFSDGTAPRVAFSPPPTAISEFRVQTTAFDASLGHTMGSTVNVSTKSGTNAVHGEMHHWLRHSVFDAPTIFNNRAGQKLPVYQDNRYGFSIGAPITVPKVYNGKNRTFWFFAYEANKFGNPEANTSTVPTEKMRNGDLSEWLARGAGYQVYDPRSTQLVGGRYVRQPIPGNILPASRLDPVGMNLIKLYPLPNQTGTVEQRNNYFRTGKALEDYWVWLGRFDHAFSENHRMFLRLHRDYWEEDKNRVFSNDVVGVILNRNNKGIALDDVVVFGPTFLANFRYGLTFQDFPERRTSRGADLTGLGFSQNLLNLIPDKTLATLPNVGVAPFTSLASWESGDGLTASTTHSFVGNFTKMWGNHSFRFGPEYRIYRESRNRFHQAISPQFSFNATYTRANDTAANPTLGGEVAAMLLGIPAGSMSIVDSYIEQDKYFAMYLQDDWKVSKKLTLNVGIRYEYETPLTERFNRSAIGFAGTTANPLDAAARVNYAANPIPELPASQFRALGGLTFAGVGGNSRSFWNSPKLNLMPRFGLAYQMKPKTIIRAGYGVYFASIGSNYSNSNQSGFAQSTPMQASLDNGITFIATNANPFPTGLIKPLGAAGGLMTNIGQDLNFWAADRRNPYAQRYSFGVQQELPQKFMIEVSYVGNRNTRLNINRNLNYTPAQYLSTSPVRDQNAINFLGQNFRNPFFGLNPIFGQNQTRGSLLRAYPHFGNVTLNADPAGYSWYHSMQSRIERRMANGWTVQGSYTYSKAMEATEFLNVQDAMPYETVAALDRTHRFTGSGIWEIPFGRGRKFGSQMHRALDFAAGGWQLGGLYQHQTGAPLGFGNRIFNGDLKNIVLPEGKRGVDGWFNVDAGFNRVVAQQLASNLRTFPIRFSGVRGPTQDRWDFSLIKNFQITERWNTQFRAETFNAMNHPNLSDPNTDPTSSAFGTITGQDSPRSWQMSLKITF
ncbi:MAG: carboxypeptidase regulatory-like domain-containing protein [Bryobacterales bacterium]|nr:carboxypeptidase regulatory-like domain-containing protein [Bryobacterales bacterium]